MVMSFAGLCSRYQHASPLTCRRERFFSPLISVLHDSFFTPTPHLFSFLVYEYPAYFSFGLWGNHIRSLSIIGLIRKPDLVSELNVTRCKAVR
ncbi:hypothetical protein EDC54_103137 [Samsonia erythrinae]|uniref:Uncharacterized protein n=1 Tax=Samsonia erythrinae TaxID=160434 RepID=A0A4R3VNW9_9GAMM|nr:hypothetical protein EDC54_103137 [Samsonia erythrinae]